MLPNQIGRYEVLGQLATGGMAEILLARLSGPSDFRRAVVIKRILPELAASEEFVDMFIHEAKLAVRLSHANIVQVFDLGIAPGTVVGGIRQPSRSDSRQQTGRQERTADAAAHRAAR